MGHYRKKKGGINLPRKRRDSSPLKCYHIIARGINKQDVFFDMQDKMKFIKEITRTKEKYNYNLYAYVLMPNHIHLLIKEEQASISDIMRSLLMSYAEYFNKKYERIGYVFQDRFNSKPIMDDSYLKNAVRYIHLNPTKAGIASYDDYKWSSYQSYFQQSNNLVDVTEEIKNKFTNGKENFEISFKMFHKDKSMETLDEEIMNYELKKVLEDEELYEVIKSTIIQDVTSIQRLQKRYRDQVLQRIFEIKGINCKQISRVTGINIKIIKNAREKMLREKRKDITKNHDLQKIYN